MSLARLLIAPMVVLLALTACSSSEDKSADASEPGGDADGSDADDSDGDDSGDRDDSGDWCQSMEATGWSESTHAKGHDGDYETVFGQAELPRLDITICPDDYAAMRDELVELLGSPSGSGGRPEFPETKPTYVPVTVAFEGQTWPYVGMRHKGNSSLAIAWHQGIEKLPFRLEFDQYEDEVEEVDNQRFHGFKELKFSSAFEDPSLIRDKLSSDLFREAGVPAAAGGLMAVYVDAGEGPIYWGVYAGFEDPAGELLDSWFGDDNGNLYKPDGDEATLSGFDEEVFEKKTNEEEADWSDVQAFIEALNDDTTDAETWRAELEATFDVDAFLRYLALNNLIGNWDSYGNMTHNYYLYGDPALDGRLVWIPWDFNEAMRTNGKAPNVHIDMTGTSRSWPLLHRIADDPVYMARYTEHLTDVMATVFTEDKVRERAEALHERIAEAVAEESAPYTHLRDPRDFDQALDASDGVVTRVATARAEAELFLAD